MGQPNVNNVHIDAILTNISVAYMQDQSKYIFNKVFPLVGVAKASDKFYTYSKNDWLRDEAKRRADSTESAGSGYTLGTDTYSCDVYAFHKDIGDKTRKNADAPLNLDREATQFVMSRILLRQEIQFFADFFKAGLWGTTVTGGTEFVQWSDYANSDPIEDVDTAKEAILKVTGLLPNTLVIGWQTWRKLKNHPIFTDRVKYTSSQNITTGIVAAMLEVDNLYVTQAIKATNNELATGAYDFIHGKNALLCYSAPNPGLLTPSAGYVFTWNGLSDGLNTPVATKTFRMEALGADRIESEAAWDNKMIAADLGYYFDAVVA